MSHHPKGTRKTKSTRMEHPSRTHQVSESEPPKEKLAKMTQCQRRVKTTSQQVLEAPTKVIMSDLHRFGVSQIVSGSKNQAREGGGGHREPSLTPSPTKTSRYSVTTSSVQKITPKESKEQTEYKDFVNSKEYKELKKYNELKEYKALKESKPHKEPKEPHAKEADKSPNASHRHTRHQANRTKNYFDKYLKFAFDLSTPEGVQQLEAHFFPPQDPISSGTSTNMQD